MWLYDKLLDSRNQTHFLSYIVDSLKTRFQLMVPNHDVTKI